MHTQSETQKHDVLLLLSHRENGFYFRITENKPAVGVGLRSAWVLGRAFVPPCAMTRLNSPLGVFFRSK